MLPVSLSDLTTEIETYYRQTRPFREHVEEKEKLFKYIADSVSYLHREYMADLKEIKNGTPPSFKMTKQKFLENMSRSQTSNKPWSVFKFGGESWGISGRESDTDIAIRLNFRNNRSDKKFLLNELSQFISNNDNNGVLMVQSILNAKYPIIRIHHLQFKYIKFDISIADRFCFKRNKLILEYIEHFQYKYNIPMKQIIVFIKYWSKQRGINNAYHCYLNSFGFTLLIIKFIQSLVVDRNKNIHNKPLSYFVYEFFVFYALKYDQSKHGICITSEYVFDKKRDLNCLMEVIDPVNYENNVAQKVGYYQYTRTKSEFVRSLDIFKEHTKHSQLSLFELLTQRDDDVSVESGYSSNDMMEKSESSFIIH